MPISRDRAAQIRSVAKSLFPDYIKLMKLEQKFNEAKAEFERQAAEIKADIESGNRYLREKSGGYGFDDLFEIVTNHESGKKDFKWKYETYLPEEAPQNEEANIANVINGV